MKRWLIYWDKYSKALHKSQRAVQTIETLYLPESDIIEMVHEIINEIDDDQNTYHRSKDKVLLVVEDDRSFAK
jgi:hypothetical protein